MEQFIYRNNKGDSITIAYNSSSYILFSYDGLTSSEIIPITTTGYLQAGNTFLNNKLGARLINISFYVAGNGIADLYEKRRYIERVFNPTLGEGILQYTNDYLSKSISCAVYAVPYPTEKNGSLQLFNVELVANNPLWYDNNISALKLGDFIGGLKFPIKFQDSIIFAQKGDVAIVENIGDVPAPITVEFRNNSLNPKLTLINTGDFIKLNTEIDDDEKLTVNTAYGNKTAVYTSSDGTESSAYHLITTDSKFFSLPIGENQLSFAGDYGTPEVYIYWRNWYVGV